MIIKIAVNNKNTCIAVINKNNEIEWFVIKWLERL